MTSASNLNTPTANSSRGVLLSQTVQQPRHPSDRHFQILGASGLSSLKLRVRRPAAPVRKRIKCDALPLAGDRGELTPPQERSRQTTHAQRQMGFPRIRSLPLSTARTQCGRTQLRIRSGKHSCLPERQKSSRRVPDRNGFATRLVQTETVATRRDLPVPRRVSRGLVPRGRVPLCLHVVRVPVASF